MIRFLFWNVCGVANSTERFAGKVRPLSTGDARYTRLQRALQVVAGRENLDVIVLAESPFEGHLQVSGFSEAQTTLPPNKTTRTRLEVYHRSTVAFTGVEVVERAVLHDMTVRASGQTILLASAHLWSPPRPGEATRAKKVESFAADIRDRENALGHRRTVLLGDLNYDPHDTPVTSAYGLNAVPTKAIAIGGTRRVSRDSFPFFYNPMWAHLSDVTATPPGTYYRRTSDIDCRFWYLPDQVLIRPDLIDSWNDADLRILSRAGKINLRDNQGQPWREMFSDHLPVVFALNL